MLALLPFFAIWMVLFYRFPSWWFFGIASSSILGGIFLAGFHLLDHDRLGINFASFWIAYAACWMLIGAVVRSRGAKAAAARKLRSRAAAAIAAFDECGNRSKLRRRAISKSESVQLTHASRALVSLRLNQSFSPLEFLRISPQDRREEAMIRLHGKSMDIPEPRTVTEVDAQIGEAIRVLRKGLGFTQADIADLVGISKQQFQKYEAGDSRISAALLLRIALVLGCLPQDLFPGRPKERAAKAGKSDVMGLQLQRAFERIRSKRERKMVLDLARRFGEPAKGRSKR